MEKQIHARTKDHQIICTDALPFLDNFKSPGSVITSLPDAHEINLSLSDWKIWFVSAARKCLEFAAPNAPTIFFQTDRRADGRTISKFDLCMQAANSIGYELVFHKIVLRQGYQKINLFRPTFSHLICFGRNITVGKISQDVIENGEMLWAYGMGRNACRVALGFVRRFSNVVYDPFCGMGTVLLEAKKLGMNCVGIEIDKKRAQYAEELLNETQVK